MKEIRKCPFCGGEVKIETSKDWFEDMRSKHGFSLIRIKCCTSECEAQISSWFATDDYEVAVDKAIDKWNQRVPNV